MTDERLDVDEATHRRLVREDLSMIRMYAGIGLLLLLAVVVMLAAMLMGEWPMPVKLPD